MTFDKFHLVWMMQKMKKRRRIENFEIQELREIVKGNAPHAVERFENKYKEFRIEGKRKALSASATNYAEKLPKMYYTKEESKEVEAMYMGTESEARKRYQENRSYSRQQSQS